MPDYCHIDYETYSECDLTKQGVYRYVDDYTTDVLCCAYAFDDGPVKLWLPGDPYPFRGFNGTFLAWNAGFERLVTNAVMTDLYGWDEIELERWQCVAAQARCQALPSALEKAAMFMGSKHKKDMAGHRLMLKMCKPAQERYQLDFWKRYAEAELKSHEQKMLEKLEPEEVARRCHHTEENIKRLGEYCVGDIGPERDIHHKLDPWDEHELKVYYLNEKINDRGVSVDLKFARAATQYAADENMYFTEQLTALTDGYIKTPKQYQKHREWVMPKVSDDVIEIMSKYEKGVKKYSLDAAVRERLILAFEDNADFMPLEVYEVIRIIDDASKSTIAKYKAIEGRALRDWTDFDTQTPRVHGLYVHAGAAQTLRFSSKGLQLHNLSRVVHPKSEALIGAFKADDDKAVYAEGNPIHNLAKLIRPTFRAQPGKKLIWGDWSAIEARVLPWLAEPHPAARELLEMFRSGRDVYIKVASEILHKQETDITDDERQSHGKVPQLSLGFGGGKGALLAMAKGYRVHMAEDTAKSVVVTWRKTNPWAPVFWAKVEKAALNAMRFEGRQFQAGRLTYEYDSESLGGLGALWCLLPSGLNLCYPGARIELITTPWGEEKKGITAMKGAWTPAKDAKDWPRVTLWPGLLVENATQSEAGSVLKEAMLRCSNYGLHLVMHTHDELVCEEDEDNAEKYARALKDLMVHKPDWCMDLPLDADIEIGDRYKVKENG